MILAFIYTALGLVILLLAGDSLVKGAVNMSLRLGVPALIVSLTIVAFGTSAPELLIGIKAIMDDAPGIALGNVVGSNTANILLVLGIPAIISVLNTSTCNTRKSYVYMILATFLFIGLSFWGPFTWWHGLVLLAVLAGILGEQLLEARQHRKTSQAQIENGEEVEGADPSIPWWKIVMFLLLGLIGLPLGADLLVTNAVTIAESFGVSETVIGLTLVAIGTSLPELATTVMAALRQQAAVALGNVIGSNMFNLLAIIGITSLVGQIPVDPSFLKFDLWVMLAASILLVPFVFFRMDMGRVTGGLLTTAYVVYLVILLTK